MVRAVGYQARSCSTGAAALRFLQEHPGLVRLVMADLAMPRMDGGELAERVKDLCPKLPVALMAGLVDPYADDLVEGYAELPFIGKPVALDQLAELLLSLLGSPAPTSDPQSMRRVVARRRSSGQTRIP